MRSLLRKCVICNEYTLREEHCNSKTKIPIPARFSPQDNYGDYRRKLLRGE